MWRIMKRVTWLWECLCEAGSLYVGWSYLSSLWIRTKGVLGGGELNMSSIRLGTFQFCYNWDRNIIWDSSYASHATSYKGRHNIHALLHVCVWWITVTSACRETLCFCNSDVNASTKYSFIFPKTWKIDIEISQNVKRIVRYGKPVCGLIFV